MTMPDERARALKFAGELLYDLMDNPNVPASVKHEAWATLRHYPSARELKDMVRDVHHLTLNSPKLTMHWLAPEKDPK